MTPREPDVFIKSLLNWYDANARALPWRKDKDPYRVWLSEIMLQQTRVEAVIPYYERFLRELPDIAALAGAPQEKLMKLWQGLGYYRRARNMQLAAKTVTETLGGAMPATAEELKTLPGIGEYTAGAIASIAYGERVAAVDGNVIRVFARLLGILESPEETRTAAKIRQEVIKSLPDSRIGDYNQALMELGATVCLPNGGPLCDKCPLAAFCIAKENNLTSAIPKKSAKKERPVQRHTVLILDCGGRFALEKRGDNVLLASLWQFPLLPGACTLEDCKKALPFLSDDNILSVSPAPVHTHIFTHLTWDLCGYYIRLKELPSPTDYTWATEEEIGSYYSVPSAFRPYIELCKSRI